MVLISRFSIIIMLVEFKGTDITSIDKFHNMLKLDLGF
jgi:hypothetical protein